MRLVGLTGSIAAGKSTVSAWLRQLGVTVIDADALARQVIAAGTSGAAEVKRVFGQAVMGVDGSVDRAALAAVIFADPAARKRLEAIIHPRVRARAQELIVEAQTLGQSVVVEDIPLLVETGQAGRFDVVLVVEAPAELRLQRLVEGRGMNPDEAADRMAAQATTEQRAAVADVIFDGSGTVEALQAQVTTWWQDFG